MEATITISHVTSTPGKDNKVDYTLIAVGGTKYKSKDQSLGQIKTGDMLELDYEDYKWGTTIYHNIKSWKKIGNGRPVQPGLTPPLPSKTPQNQNPAPLTPMGKEILAKYRNVALMQAVEFCKESPMASPDLITDTADKFYSWLVKNA